MPFGADPVVLTEEERLELQQITLSRTLPAGDVMRARMVLLLSQGTSYRRIQTLLDTTAPTISRWKERFVQHRIAGLTEERHPGQKPSVRTPKLQARILTAIKDGPKDGSTHWSCRKLASRFGVSKDTIQRILAQADVRPHRLERYMASDDPNFEAKALTLSPCTCLRRSMRPCFAWMRRLPFKRWIALILCFRYRPAGWSGMDSNIVVTARSLCTRP